MDKLVAALSQRTWFQLRLTARAHHLRFNTHWTLEQAHAQVYARVAARLAQQFRALSAPELRALQTLQAADAHLARWRFTRHFGSLRPCTQRRPTDWRAALTPAERLWLGGFIELSRDGRHIWLTREAAALLPPLPHPQRRAVPVSNTVPRAALCTDLAAWLGTLL